MMHAASCELRNKTNVKPDHHSDSHNSVHIGISVAQGLTAVISYQYLYLVDRDRIYLDSNLILVGKGIVTHLNSRLEGTAEKTGNGGQQIQLHSLGWM